MSPRRHTVVFGLGITGDSCVRFLHATDRLTVVDTRANPPFAGAIAQRFADVELLLGTATAERVADADRIVVSPGVPMSHCLLRIARERGIPLIGDIELFLEHAQAPVIGVTGTNGKSTVTALTGLLLRAAGRNVGVGGNLGEAALDLLDGDREAYVVELSSFQLERLNTGRIGIAANMNVTPDHLDRYPDVAAYAAAKQRIFVGADAAVFNRADPLTRPVAAVGRSISVGLDAPVPGGWGIVERNGARFLAREAGAVLEAGALRIRGRHNEFNALMALALVDAAGVDPTSVVDALRGFAGLDHRCRTIAVSAGVTYIDDSKATNVGACLAALDGLGEPRRHIILIAGGDAKNADLSPLRAPVAKYVRDVVTLGKDAAAVENAIADAAPVRRVQTLRDAVEHARAIARPGDLVLLSPACASLDMFRNFEDRGRQFAAAVLDLSR